MSCKGYVNKSRIEKLQRVLSPFLTLYTMSQKCALALRAWGTGTLIFFRLKCCWWAVDP